MDKKNKVVLITGASSGIGKELALAYASPNITLLLSGRNIKRLENIANQSLEKGSKVETTSIDIVKDSFRDKIIEWDNKYNIDIVIANAGISNGTCLDKSSNAKDFENIIDVNLGGTLNTINPLIPRMIERQAGHIILMSSIAGFRGMPNAPAYSVSKVAIRAYGDALRPLLSSKNIIVSTIFPGFVKTPLTDINKFPMPFLISAEKAANIIKNGIDNKKASIAFPWIMHLFAWFLGIAPRFMGDIILKLAPKKA